MNNKGFNWFFPIMIVALLLFFVPILGDSSKTIDEDGFFREMQAGKVQNLITNRLRKLMYF
jgi:cell division protease FtsH